MLETWVLPCDTELTSTFLAVLLSSMEVGCVLFGGIELASIVESGTLLDCVEVTRIGALVGKELTIVIGIWV